MRLSFEEVALLVLVAQRAPDSITARLGRKLTRAYADLAPSEPVKAQFVVKDRYGNGRPAHVATRKAARGATQDEGYGKLSLTAPDVAVLTEALYDSKVKAYTVTQLEKLFELLAKLEIGKGKVTSTEVNTTYTLSSQLILPGLIVSSKVSRRKLQDALKALRGGYN